MNVLVLLAGPEEEFSKAGYVYPKNLIEINGLPLVQRLIESVDLFRKKGITPIFLVRKEENRKHFIGEVIRLILDKAVVIEVESLTAGAPCTALYAMEWINTDTPLIVMNGDQIVDVDMSEVIKDFTSRNLDAGVVTFKGVHPRWSFIRVNKDELAVEVAEKRPISELATVGIYFFRKGRDFVWAVQEMIKKDARVEQRFYITPCLNELILKGQRIGHHLIPRDKYFPLKLPQNIEEYEQYLRSKPAG